MHADPLAALARHGMRTLLPLLDWSLRECGEGLAPHVRDGLRAAALAERARAARYDAIIAGLSPLLESRRVLVLKGAALAELAYPERRLRHCHDIDLVTTAVARGEIVREIARLGYAAGPASSFVHASGLPLRVHTGFFGTSGFKLDFDDVWAQREAVSVGGVAVQTPSPAHALVQVCGHAAGWHGPESLRWVADAVFLARLPRMDWAMAEHAARVGGAIVPAALALQMLSGIFGVAVPAGTLDTLRARVNDVTLAGLGAVAIRALGRDPRRLIRAWRG